MQCVEMMIQADMASVTQNLIAEQVPRTFEGKETGTAGLVNTSTPWRVQALSLLWIHHYNEGLREAHRVHILPRWLWITPPDLCGKAKSTLPVMTPEKQAN